MGKKIPVSVNGDLRVTYTGHSTVLIEIDGVRLLTDPLLRRRVAHLSRLVDPPEPTDWNLDAILISHLHFDHMDPPSLRQLGNDTRIIAPAGTRTFLRRRGFNNVTEIGRDEQIYIRGVRILATEADHRGDRPPFGPKLDSIGFLLEGEQQVYFAGDTDIFPEMSDLGRRNLNLALLPVWGYGPTLGGGHLDPYRAAQSLRYLMPDVVVPIHWGTYCPMGMNWMHMPFMHHPPYAFQRHAGIIAPDVRVEILEPGESYTYEPLLLGGIDQSQVNSSPGM